MDLKAELSHNQLNSKKKWGSLGSWVLRRGLPPTSPVTGTRGGVGSLPLSPWRWEEKSEGPVSSWDA